MHALTTATAMTSIRISEKSLSKLRKIKGQILAFTEETWSYTRIIDTVLDQVDPSFVIMLMQEGAPGKLSRFQIDAVNKKVHIYDKQGKIIWSGDIEYGERPTRPAQLHKASEK